MNHYRQRRPCGNLRIQFLPLFAAVSPDTRSPRCPLPWGPSASATSPGNHARGGLRTWGSRGFIQGSFAPRLSTGLARSKAIYADCLLRGSLRGSLAPRLSTGLARAEDRFLWGLHDPRISTGLAPRLYWKLAHSEALYEACSEAFYEALYRARSLQGFLRGSLAPRLSTRMARSSQGSLALLILGSLWDFLVPRLSTVRSLQGSLWGLYNPRLFMRLAPRLFLRLTHSEAFYKACSLRGFPPESLAPRLSPNSLTLRLSARLSSRVNEALLAKGFPLYIPRSLRPGHRVYA